MKDGKIPQICNSILFLFSFSERGQQIPRPRRRRRRGIGRSRLRHSAAVKKGLSRKHGESRFGSGEVAIVFRELSESL